MSQNRNLFVRALDALVEGRQRRAERYVARFEQDLRRNDDLLTKR